MSWFDGLNYDPCPMTRTPPLSWLLVAVLPLAFGCAAQSDDRGKQIVQLSEQVRRLQATTDRLQERLSALENARAREAERPPRVTQLAPEIPTGLPVVKMSSEPGSSSPEASSTTTDDDEPRPLIVGEGARIETRTSGAETSAPGASPRRAKDKPATDSSIKRSNATTESGKKSR